MLVLTARDIRTIASQAMAREAVRAAAVAYVDGRSIVPARTVLDTVAPSGEVLVMPAHQADSGSTGVKIWSRFEVPSGIITEATIVHQVPVEGIEVVLDGSSVTNLRTGAMSAVAAEYLAPRETRVIAIFGAGIQARAHLEAMVDVLPDLSEVRIVSRSAERRGAWVAWAQETFPVVRFAPYDDAGTAVDGADIVITATTASEPVFPDGAVRGGALVCGVGSHSREAAELPGETVARAKVVVVDTRRGAVDGAGDIADVIERGALDASSVIELGELVAGHRRVERHDDGVSVFKSVGFAGLDLALTDRIVAAARASGLGLEVELH